jgi:hypothetical protein
MNKCDDKFCIVLCDNCIHFDSQEVYCELHNKGTNELVRCDDFHCCNKALGESE